MAQESPDVEILVHVTAPSLGADDARYRKLAQTYLDFQPESEININDTDIEDNETNSNPNSIQQTGTRNGSSNSSKSHFTPPASLDLSFNSVLDNKSSPHLKSAVAGSSQDQDHVVIPSSQNEPNTSQQPRETLPSQIEDSYPLPNAARMFISPTRALQEYMDVSPTSSPAKDQGSPQDPQVICIESTKEFLETTAVENLSTLLPAPTPAVMVIPSSPQKEFLETTVDGDLSTLLPASNPAVIVPPFSQQKEFLETAVDENLSTLLPASNPAVIVIPSSEQQPLTDEVVPVKPIPHDKGKEKEVDNPNIGHNLDITHISNTELSIAPVPSTVRAASEPPQPKRLKTITDRNFLARSASDTATPIPHGISQLPTEIWSPAPPVGVDDLDPTAMIPDKLQKLAADLSSRYKPETGRELNPMERGYWLLDCRRWTHEVRQGMWSFLIRYVEAGMAGWGVWCHRDAHIDRIRLYGWGHIAKHTYLLLYLASGRMLKYTGAVWKDAEGEAILRVTPHEKHEQQNQI